MEGHELAARSLEGFHVISYAVELASVSQNHVNRPLDEFFTVKLCYQDESNPNERSLSFKLEKEIEGVWDVLQAVSKELDTLNADTRVYDYVAEVVSENCDYFRKEVLDVGRTSLAMIVKIGVGERFTVHYEDVPEIDMYDDFEEDDEEEEEEEVEEEEEEEEEPAVMMSSVEAKNFLSRIRGVRFIGGDQVSTNMECCSICLEEFEKREKKGDGKHDDNVVVLPCSHVFHEDCLVSWVVTGKKTCPFCRFKLLPC